MYIHLSCISPMPLPLDLERLIFEIAALQHTNHKSRVQLALVAKRVYEWLRPILFRVVVIRNTLKETSGALTIHNWRKAQITNSARFVRHLSMITLDSHQLIDIISTFPNIEDLRLASWTATSPISSELVTKLNDLTLRRLSIDLVPPPMLDQTPAFKNLTHLEIFFPAKLTDEDVCKALIRLPKLTHLSFTYCYVKEAVVLDLLKHCASLQVLMCFTNSMLWATKSEDPRYLVFLDPPSLQVFIEEWVRSANGLVGCWELAEVIIDARKANLFKDTAPSILLRNTWMEHLNGDGRRWYKEWSRVD